MATPVTLLLACPTFLLKKHIGLWLLTQWHRALLTRTRPSVQSPKQEETIIEKEVSVTKCTIKATPNTFSFSF